MTTTYSDHPMPRRPHRIGGLAYLFQQLRLLYEYLRNMMVGHVNWVNEVQIKNGTTSTVVSDLRVLDCSQITLMAEDAAGGTAIQAAYIDTITEQSGTGVGAFTIHHATPGANATLRYCIKG